MKRGEVLDEGSRVVIACGRHAGQPGVVTEIRGSGCTVELVNGNEYTCEQGGLRLMSAGEVRRYEQKTMICGE